MGKSIRTLFLVAFLGAIFSTTASAQLPCYHQGSWRYGIFTGSYSPRGYLPCYYRSDRDFRLGATMYWNQAGRDAIQGYVRDGQRYTHDMTDLDDNLTTYSNWWSTNFPSPYPDWDDDDDDGKWEEWEVTVEDSSFPVVSRNYWLTFYARTVPSGWQSGTVAHTPAISEKLWYTSDLWDTYRYSTTPYNQYYSTTWNGLFGDEEPKDATALRDGGKPDRENPNEKPVETISFPQPLAIGDFHAQLRPEDKTIVSFVLAYEVETEQGTQTVYVGGVPSEFELFPLARAEEELRSAPVTLGAARLLGVTSYRIERAIQNDE